MRPEGREPLPDKAGESTLLSRSGGALRRGRSDGEAGEPSAECPDQTCSPSAQLGQRVRLWLPCAVCLLFAFYSCIFGCPGLSLLREGLSLVASKQELLFIAVQASHRGGHPLATPIET